MTSWLTRGRCLRTCYVKCGADVVYDANRDQVSYVGDPPPPRTQYGLAAEGGKLYVFGGFGEISPQSQPRALCSIEAHPPQFSSCGFPSSFHLNTHVSTRALSVTHSKYLSILCVQM
eukprot:1923043-Rhodomonas_salina.1